MGTTIKIVSLVEMPWFIYTLNLNVYFYEIVVIYIYIYL